MQRHQVLARHVTRAGVPLPIAVPCVFRAGTQGMRHRIHEDAGSPEIVAEDCKYLPEVLPLLAGRRGN
jgi:hypothetical protein